LSRVRYLHRFCFVLEQIGNDEVQSRRRDQVESNKEIQLGRPVDDVRKRVQNAAALCANKPVAEVDVYSPSATKRDPTFHQQRERMTCKSRSISGSGGSGDVHQRLQHRRRPPVGTSAESSCAFETLLVEDVVKWSDLVCNVAFLKE